VKHYNFVFVLRTIADFQLIYLTLEQEILNIWIIALYKAQGLNIEKGDLQIDDSCGLGDVYLSQ
jgi:hypothetical protein